ncbi:hypothetical protein CVT24_000300 [Panaeolus cyanescens]|uniref:CBS domain-containing protein n=1 Tax=Panaeolus cyanescens TaxID=181874 RepID=A0A409W395_9AGAR|nr:hypothetical protein CVT24_000300 [Panaeolus cyanescens]
MSQSNRLSQSLTGSWKELSYISTHSANDISDELVDDWLVNWKTVLARDLLDTISKIVEIDAHASVEEACELLLSESTPCLAIKTQDSMSNHSKPYLGLFDYADVNAFLTLAATRHTLQPDDIRDNGRIQDIVAAAKAGQVPVHLVSNLSEKNPIEALSHDANLISLLEVFARGTHRVLVQSAENASTFMGMISDRQLLSWFDDYAHRTPSFQKYLANPISALGLPSVNLNADVISTKSTSSILDAMKLMSEQGVSSVAVIEDGTSHLLSAVSVTDIVVPSQSNQILAMPLQHFIAHVKEPDGSTDGADKYPVVSSSPLFYTIGKILATNAHRVFVTRESALASPVLSASSKGNVTGLVSIVDSALLKADGRHFFLSTANVIVVKFFHILLVSRKSRMSIQLKCNATVGHHRPPLKPLWQNEMYSCARDQIAGQVFKRART